MIPLKVLDSDLLIDFFGNKPDAVSKVESLQASGEEICTTVFNAQEVLFGFAEKEQAKYAMARSFLLDLGLLGYSLGEAESALKVRKSLERPSMRIGLVDEMIGGICLSHGAAIVTRSVRHFSRISGLHVEEW